MPRDIRRVITGHNDDGKSLVIIDPTMTADLGHVLTPEGRHLRPARHSPRLVEPL